ncbi:tRNA-dihydrouridine synthase family protein [Halodesulfovibrio sp.]|jgi:tRNA-dihydrouridine synthase B|uniref:tRNA dihydrouridine synthase n=1 Tax=Halodesulfovibrio sp. TaxID=1912772 RepID=UPI0025FDA7CB|nr:tRNA-dihydrouridine synthase family protein [Halodesulfovibrio sp.]MCT4627010.1 tRNA-dihydrouridine synthase family protein [Halodesulfovibrio sp.]
MQYTDNTGLNISPERPWLAPLAGYSDLCFRLLCKEFGAAVVCSEMVSAKGLYYKSNNTHKLLETTEKESPAVFQLFGNDADIMSQAMEPLVKAGYTWFDLNMGCSVRKVFKQGCGSSMMRDIDNSIEVAKAMIAIGGKGKVGFKFRLGVDSEQEVYKELALRLEDAGAGWLTLHPRTAAQGFSGTARWSAIKEVVEAVSIPVIASGDLLEPEDGVRCVKETGAASVMFARGAIGNPAIFDEYITLIKGETLKRPDPLKTMQLIQRHKELAREYTNERSALFKMRTFVPRYVRLFKGAKALRQQLSTCTDWEQLDAVIEEFFARCEAVDLDEISETISMQSTLE